TATRVRQPYNLRSRLTDALLIIAGDVCDQHHLRPLAAAGLGRITDRLQIAFIQMFQSGQHRGRMSIEVVLDLDDSRYSLSDVAEELQTHGTHMLGHAMQDECRRRDKAVTAFFLDAWQTGQELVGNVLAETNLTETGAGNLKDLGLRLQSLAVGVVATDLESRHVHIMDLAEIMVDAFNL